MEFYVQKSVTTLCVIVIQTWQPNSFCDYVSRTYMGNYLTISIKYPKFGITYSTEHRHSWEANSSSASEEIPLLSSLQRWFAYELSMHARTCYISNTDVQVTVENRIHVHVTFLTGKS